MTIQAGSARHRREERTEDQPQVGLRNADPRVGDFDKYEMTIKLRWNVDNIFDCLVRGSGELRELRDRVFSDPEPLAQ